MLHDDLVTEGAYAHATLCMPISACPYEIGTQHWCAGAKAGKPRLTPLRKRIATHIRRECSPVTKRNNVSAYLLLPLRTREQALSDREAKKNR